MRGIPSLITDIRKQVFTEVARMAYSGHGYEGAEELPYKIVPGDRPLHRDSVFLERAIAGERVRLAMGLGLRPASNRVLITQGILYRRFKNPCGYCRYYVLAISYR